MVLLVLLLFCSCLACLREGVWTQYTSADVARWQAHAHPVDETAAPRQPLPTPRLVALHTTLRSEPAADPADEMRAQQYPLVAGVLLKPFDQRNIQQIRDHVLPLA